MRFLLKLQRSRAGVYLLAFATAMLFRSVGVIEISLLAALAIVGCGFGSAVLASVCISRRPPLYAALHGTVLSLSLDIALVTWGVAASGGLRSPWYLWYLAIAGAGAFAAGRRGALLVSIGDFVAYLGTLAWRGEIGLLDAPCLDALARIVFLHGAAFFFLRGVADLAARRMEIKRLREADSRRLADLERLATALDQRTRELSGANSRIREADRQKSRFLANVSHELRTPLNSILGFSQILSTRFGPELAEKPRRFASNIHTSGEHLLRVLDDVLDLSKIEAGRMTLVPEELDAGALVEHVLAAAHFEAEPRGIALVGAVGETLPPLEADPLKVKQILLNLLTNAIHFSPDGGTVTAGAEFLEAGDSALGFETIRFWVRDEGIGIEPEDHELVFDEFRQARHRARAGGTGLGLALVKSLAELHRGKVGLSSVPGRGSTFHVDLPRKFGGSRDARDDASSSGEVPSISSARVLLVAESDVAALQTGIELLDCLALAALPGPEAFRLSRTLRPAAVVVAVDGPESWKLLRRLRADAETREIPVVLCAVEKGQWAAIAADELVFGPLHLEQGQSARSAEEVLLDLGAGSKVLSLALELSHQAERTGLPRLRLFVPAEEAEQRITSRLAALASSSGESPETFSKLVVTVARRALARAGASSGTG